MLTRPGIESAFARWTPSTPPSAPEVASTEGIKETAALSIDTPDHCPYCKQAMRASSAVGIKVFVCDNDRYVAPCPNDVPVVSI